MTKCRCGHDSIHHDEGYCMVEDCKCRFFMHPMTNTLGQAIGSIEELLTRAGSWEHEALVNEKWGKREKAAAIRKVAERIFNEAMDMETKNADVATPSVSGR